MIWAYCRVSTTHQEQELSLETQEAWARAHAASEGSTIRTFVERASAKSTMGRPIFQAMMAELHELPAAKRPKQIAVTSFDRLSRDMTDTLVVARSLRAMKVALYVRDAGGIVKAETFAQRAALVGQSMGGEAENEAKSNRARASWARRAAEGKPLSNKAPYGIQLRAERDTPAPETSEWVVRAFEWYAAGDGMPTIAMRMRSAPIHRVETTRVGPDGMPIVRERATLWEPNRVKKMLVLARYRGTIVPEELFDRVQTMLATKPRWRQDRKREYPLSGAMRCRTCNRNLHGRASGRGTKTVLRKRTNDVVAYKGKDVRYYSCSVCAYEVNATRVETQFREMLGALVADDALLARYVAGDDAAADVRDARREIARLERAIDPSSVEAERERIWTFAMNAGPHAAADLEKRLAAVAERVARDRARLAELSDAIGRRERTKRAVSTARDLLARFWVLYEAGTYDQKRELIGSVVSALGGLAIDRDGLRWVRELEAPLPRRAQRAKSA